MTSLLYYLLNGPLSESVRKANILSHHFDSKQSWEFDDLPPTCHPTPNLITFAFRSSEVRRLFSDLAFYGSTVPLGIFPLLLKRTDNVSVLCIGGFFV